MLSNVNSVYLGYSEIHSRTIRHPLIASELPTGYVTSLGLPTKRWHVAAYAYFSSPATTPREGVYTQSPPAMWWIIDAKNADLLVYARVTAMPFARDEDLGEPVSIVSAGETLQAFNSRRERIWELIEMTATSFFDDRPADTDLKHELAALLRRHIPGAVVRYYELLSSDFFRWLLDG